MFDALSFILALGTWVIIKCTLVFTGYSQVGPVTTGYAAGPLPAQAVYQPQQIDYQQQQQALAYQQQLQQYQQYLQAYSGER